MARVLVKYRPGADPAADDPRLLDPIDYAWRALHGDEPLASAERRLRLAPQPIGPLRRDSGRKPVSVAAAIAAPEPPQAHRGAKFMEGPACPHGHTTRYVSTGACVLCLRRQVKESRERRKFAREQMAA